MTDMQGMLFPPLDDEGSSDNQGPGRDEVLPQEIKDRFSKVRSLLREQTSSQDDDGAAELKRKQEAAALEAARAVQEEVARLQNGIAELEALYAIQQRQPMHQLVRNEGEDEESDSDDNEEDEQEGVPVNNNFNNNGIVFPALPSMVNAVEPDSDADSRCSESLAHESEREESEAVLATQDILCDA